MELAMIILGLVILAQTVAIVALVWLHAGKPRIMPMAKTAEPSLPVPQKVAFYHGIPGSAPERKA